MRTSNPALNEKVFQREMERRGDTDLEAGWAQAEESYTKPAYRGPVVGDDTMTINGVVWAAAALIVLVVAAGSFGWSATTSNETTVQLPGWLFPALLGGLGVAIFTVFKPNLARFTAPVYALVMGLVVGALSKAYEGQYDGIVLQAVGLTIGVFLVMLFLYSTRIIKVTDKLRMGIVAATGAIFLVYMLNLVLRMFGASVPFIHDAGPLGIGISLVIVGVAAFNLLLDFDLVEKGVERGAPKHMEWYAAFGLLVTLIWLYLELLRLLAKLQSRD
jgi:uncharacterized YccA/Bax inhibitor family protein